MCTLLLELPPWRERWSLSAKRYWDGPSSNGS